MYKHLICRSFSLCLTFQSSGDDAEAFLPFSLFLNGGSVSSRMLARRFGYMWHTLRGTPPGSPVMQQNEERLKPSLCIRATDMVRRPAYERKQPMEENEINQASGDWESHLHLLRDN